MKSASKPGEREINDLTLIDFISVTHSDTHFHRQVSLRRDSGIEKKKNSFLFSNDSLPRFRKTCVSFSFHNSNGNKIFSCRECARVRARALLQYNIALYCPDS